MPKGRPTANMAISTQTTDKIFWKYASLVAIHSSLPKTKPAREDAPGVAKAADSAKTRIAVMMKGLAPTRPAILHRIGVRATSKTVLFINCVKTKQMMVMSAYMASGV